MLKKIFGGIFAFLVVLVLIVACFGEEGGDASKDETKNVIIDPIREMGLTEEYGYIFQKMERFEGEPVIADDGRNDWLENGYIGGFKNPRPNDKLGKIFKATKIVKTYLKKDEYQPKEKWEKSQQIWLQITCLSIPNNAEKLHFKFYEVANSSAGTYDIKVKETKTIYLLLNNDIATGVRFWYIGGGYDYRYRGKEVIGFKFDTSTAGF